MSSDFSRRSPDEGNLFDCCAVGRLTGCRGVACCRRGRNRIQRPTRPGNAAGGSRTHPRSALRSACREITDEAMRRVKQIGVNNVLMGGPKMPWQEADLQATVDKLKTGGLTVGNMMIAGFNNCIYGRAGAARDKEIEDFKTSIRAAGKVGLPVVEYNWYAHRAIEGYYLEEGRGGAGYTGFNINKVENLPTAARGRSSLQRRTVEEHYLFSAGGYSHLRAIECAFRTAP